MTHPTEPTACPWRYCAALALLIVHRTDPSDASKRVTVYPMHDVIGPGHWFGRCPASQLVMPELTDAGRAVLAAADRQYERMVAEREQADRDRHDRISELVHDMIDHPERWPEHVRPTPPSVDDYFPGRPADAPEPGVGETPDAKLPLTQIGQQLGKAEDMTTRGNLIEMIIATRNQIGKAQETLANAILALEELERASTRLGPSTDAASALADAAVGPIVQNNMPESARKMRIQLAAAKDTATGQDGIPQAIGLVRVRVTALAQQLSLAIDAAEEYQRLP